MSVKSAIIRSVIDTYVKVSVDKYYNKLTIIWFLMEVFKWCMIPIRAKVIDKKAHSLSAKKEILMCVNVCKLEINAIAM